MKLVVHALPLSVRLRIARIVPARMQRENRILARIPVARAITALRVALVHDVKAVARRTIARAHAASKARQRLFFPERGLEVVAHESIHLRRIDLLFGSLVRYGSFVGSGRLSREECLAFLGQA